MTSPKGSENIEQGDAAIQIYDIQQNTLPNAITPTQINALSSPAHSLPCEVLISIFSLLVHDTSHHEVRAFFLSRICRRWRYIVRATPTLWTHMHIAIPPRNHDMMSMHYSGSIRKAIAAMIPEWLSMTGNYPLTIHIVFFPPENLRYHEYRPSYDDWLSFAQDYQDCLYDALGLLIPHSNRWKSLLVPLLSLWQLQPLFQDSRRHLASLTSLTFKGICYDSSWPDLSTMSSLRSLTLINRCPTISLSYFTSLRWDTLTRFVCTFPLQAQCVEMVLAQCTSAVDVAFEYVFYEPGSNDDGYYIDYVYFPLTIHEEIYLPKLENLIISFSEGHSKDHEGLPNTLWHMFQVLNAPALHNLVLEMQCKPLVPFYTLSEFVIRSGCDLTKLTINGISDKTDTGCPVEGLEDLIYLLSISPSLEELNLYFSEKLVTETLWMALLDSSSFLPCMKKFQYTGPLDISDTVLVRILQLRWSAEEPNTTRLQNVVLERIEDKKEDKRRDHLERSHCRIGRRGPDEETIMKLQKLIEEGIVIIMTGHWTKDIDSRIHNQCAGYELVGYSHLFLTPAYVERSVDPYWKD